MPEGLEAEIWRRALIPLVGRRIASVWLDERVADPGLAVVLPGATVTAVERVGKVVQVRTADHALGLHFGMTGRVIVDGAAPIESLAYSSDRDRPEWDRLRLFTDPPTDSASPALRLNDPRRLGRCSLDADLTHLGIDALTAQTRRLADALTGRRAAVKTVLLDQGVIAGLGNLCADEVLWWASVAPHRGVDTLTGAERAALASAIRRRLPVMLRRGGSTHGVLDPERRRGPSECPRDGAPLERKMIGGRAAVWCPQHQR